MKIGELVVNVDSEMVPTIGAKWLIACAIERAPKAETLQDIANLLASDKFIMSTGIKNELAVKEARDLIQKAIEAGGREL